MMLMMLRVARKLLRRLVKMVSVRVLGLAADNLQCDSGYFVPRLIGD